MDVRSGRWLDRIWQSLDNYQLFCSAKNVEIQSHLMTLIARFLSSTPASQQGDEQVGEEANSDSEGGAEGGMTKIAATVTGRHTRGDTQDAVWVLNAAVHLNADGEPLTADASPYVWLGSFYKHRSSHSDTSSGILRDNSLAANVVLPLQASALVELVSALERCYENNFGATLLVLGAAVICNHYEVLFARFQQVPATIVYGEVCCGKTRATRAALSIVGAQNTNFFSSITDARSYRFAGMTTLGMVIDDPREDRELAKKISYHFDQSMVSTCARDYQPKTTFICSMNMPCLQQIAADSM